MGLMQAFDIAVSGIDAQRTQLELIASNLANINSTRTIYGGPYRRKIPIFAEEPLAFGEALNRAEARLSGGGVKLVGVSDDMSPFPRIYNPGHPDADTEGFLSLPNVSMSKEMVDMVYASRLYEANITVFNATKKMAQDTLMIP
jgi:flagellar basal-body rod protein FlgC